MGLAQLLHLVLEFDQVARVLALDFAEVALRIRIHFSQLQHFGLLLRYDVPQNRLQLCQSLRANALDQNLFELRTQLGKSA